MVLLLPQRFSVIGLLVMFLKGLHGALIPYLLLFIYVICSMFLRGFAPWVPLSLLEIALVSLHLFLISSGQEEVLSWGLFRSDSLFSSHSWGIAPALYLGRITVERPLLL